MADAFLQDMPLHRQTGATHSSFLMADGEILFRCEDIGRHNALDKAIGYGSRNGLDLKNAVLFTSGRIPTDMVMKTVRAGIPVLAGRSVPTKEAVELARRYRLILIGKIKERGMVCYTGQNSFT